MANGTWLHRAPKEHACAPPLLFPWRHAGSKWRCECGQLLIIRETPFEKSWVRVSHGYAFRGGDR